MEQTLDRESMYIKDKELLEKLLKKTPSELMEDEIAVIRARRAYLTSVEREVFKSILEEPVEKTDYSKLTVAKLKELCVERGIEIPEEVTKKDAIIALIEEADALEQE